MVGDPLLLELPRILTGENVELRAYEDSHAAAIWQAVDASRKHLAPWMPWVHDWLEPARGLHYVRQMQAHWITREDFTFGLWDRASADLVGACGLHDPDWTTPKFMIGYWIAPTFQGKGLVTEAVKLLTRFGFEHLHANRLYITCDADNVRSAAIPLRVGYTQEAYLRSERVNVRGSLSDTLMFGITRSDFLEIGRTFGPPHGTRTPHPQPPPAGALEPAAFGAGQREGAVPQLRADIPR
jgi:RimJ/RimL family protein N-acetyltransferase